MIHEEIDQILEQAFKNVMRKSKFFQANRKILRKFLDAIKQEIENSVCYEESEEDFIVRREPLKCCSDLDKDHGLVA